MADLPRGIVTFLVTDVEGSTKLWEQHPEAMRVAQARPPLGSLVGPPPSQPCSYSHVSFAVRKQTIGKEKTDESYPN
jgi:hypothetical protein